VAAVGIAAVVDALPGHGGSERPAARETPSPRARTPSASGRIDAEGVLYYTDDLCRLRGLRVADLEPVQAPEWEDCAFSLSPDGQDVMGSGVVWQRQGDLRATAISGLVYVVHDAAGWEYRLTGEALAFKPDGELTFVREGDVLELTGFCRPSRRIPSCERVLLTSRDLLGPLRHDPNVPRDPGAIDAAEVKAIAWLTPTRLVAALAFDGVADELIAVYEDKTLVGTISGFGGRVAELIVSPRRGYVGARLERPTGFVLLDRDGHPFVLAEVRRDNEGRPPFTGGRAIAWSPDDEWTAIARRDTVALFRMGSESPDFVRIEFAAHDLAWAASGEVREPAPDHRPTQIH
jgi:hypothetical protein